MENLKNFDLDAFMKQYKVGIEAMLTPELKKMKEQNESIIKLAITPLMQKNVKINGIDCIVQKFQDSVKIVLPTQEMINNYYDNIDKTPTKESWLKRIKQWLK